MSLFHFAAAGNFWGSWRNRPRDFELVLASHRLVRSALALFHGFVENLFASLPEYRAPRREVPDMV
eukprot:2058075-Rhodomonas_salina.1